jgi:Mor family transcriptional regulator
MSRHHMVRSESMESKRHELLQDVANQTKRLLVEHDVHETAADLIANAVADHISDVWGGQNLVIPKDYLRKLSGVQLEVYERFNGTNLDALAKEYGMTERGMRKLIARVRERLRRNARDMPQLFDVA